MNKGYILWSTLGQLEVITNHRATCTDPKNPMICKNRRCIVELSLLKYSRTPYFTG